MLEDFNLPKTERYTMISDKIKAFLLVLVLTMPYSCKEDSAPPNDHVRIVFCPRECDYLYATAFSYIKAYDESYSSGFREDIQKCGISCLAENFCIKVDITNFTQEELYATHDAFRYVSVSNKRIEEQILKLFHISRKSNHGVLCNFYEYREEVCDELKITASVPLFGRDAGVDISDKFIFLSQNQRTICFLNNQNDYSQTLIYGTNSVDSIFDMDDNYVGEIEDGLSINDYLTLSPLVFPSALLHLNEKPAEQLSNPVKFYVTVRLKSGKSLSDSLTVILN